jgi:hypothetical protein
VGWSSTSSGKIQTDLSAIQDGVFGSWDYYRFPNYVADSSWFEAPLGFYWYERRTFGLLIRTMMRVVLLPVVSIPIQALRLAGTGSRGEQPHYIHPILSQDWVSLLFYLSKYWFFIYRSRLNFPVNSFLHFACFLFFSEC